MGDFIYNPYEVMKLPKGMQPGQVRLHEVAFPAELLHASYLSATCRVSHTLLLEVLVFQEGCMRVTTSAALALFCESYLT